MLSAVGPPVTVRVPAKINLHLGVGDTRPDGYHDLVTVFQALNLFDEISVVAAHGARTAGAGERLATIGSGAPGVELLGDVTDADRAAVPVDATNLAWQAAVALATSVGREPDVRIGIRKAIPVAGGMAGGSADAAGTLLALSTLWRLDLGREALMEIAASVGSDVAFALHGGTALGTGRGESLVAVLSRHTFHWVVALQDHGLSTPTVFGELDRLRATATAGGGDGAPAKRLGTVEPVLEAIASGEARSLALLLGNDLQAAAVSLDPGLRRTLRAGVSAGALAGVVSGSGPTCVFLCTDGPSAVRVAAELSGAGVCRTVRVAHGPVPGARVIDGDPSRPPRGPGGPPAGDSGPNMYA